MVGKAYFPFGIRPIFRGELLVLGGVTCFLLVDFRIYLACAMEEAVWGSLRDHAFLYCIAI